ncbi:hypothetical protein H0H81_009290 [Sphagnurus paluster]|uniref:Casein kinase substrate phosphoprotein PP28 domain-containing protein n=1 Tax=Sphagnurus paluster TaxID=117069 RepID=A0A9P7GPM0_9AGAR|nr:hypothetical protein H0H81_009290 [Sphagnurus paluster]
MVRGTGKFKPQAGGDISIGKSHSKNMPIDTEVQVPVSGNHLDLHSNVDCDEKAAASADPKLEAPVAVAKLSRAARRKLREAAADNIQVSLEGGGGEAEEKQGAVMVPKKTGGHALDAKARSKASVQPVPKPAALQQFQLKIQGKLVQTPKDSDGGTGEKSIVKPNHGVEKKQGIWGLGTPRVLTRAEREKAEAKKRFLKLRDEGKTHDAKRLAKIRVEREAAQAQRKAAAEVKAAEIERKRQALVNKRG